MKAYLLLGAAALTILTGCKRSGMIDGAASAPTQSAGSPSTPGGPGASTHKNPAPDRISHGKEVDLRDHTVPGKTTLFAFTSESDQPSRSITARLHKLSAERDDIVVVEVDINRPGVQGVDWSSPVVRQYGLKSLPAFKIYGANGTIMAEGEDAASQVNKLVR